MTIEAPNVDLLVEAVEKVLDGYVFDFQEEILQKALGRIPKREAEYEAKIERDNALYELSDAVKDSGLPWYAQAALLQRMKMEFVNKRRGKNEG